MRSPMFQFAQTAGTNTGVLSSSGVLIVPHADGQMIKSSSKAGSKNGSLKLEEKVIQFNHRGYPEEVKKIAFMRAEVKILQAILQNFAGKPLPGRLVVRELLEGTPELQAALADDLKYHNGDYLKAVGKKFKTNPSTGEFLMQAGRRIIRFVDYDHTGGAPDILIAHDRNPVAPTPMPSQNAVATPTAELPAETDNKVGQEMLPF